MEGNTGGSVSTLPYSDLSPEYQWHPAATRPLLVVVTHAHPIVRAGLAALLADHSAIDVICAEPGALAQHPHADAIVADYSTALAYLERRASRLGPRVIIVTTLTKEWQVSEALRAGVQGYLLQDSAAEQLLLAVQRTTQGQRYLSEALNQGVIDSVSRINLTGRENDVLKLMAQGQCNKTIARHLGIGVGTVKTHVKGLFDKLGATARTHAVVLASRRGLVCVEAAIYD